MYGMQNIRGHRSEPSYNMWYIYGCLGKPSTQYDHLLPSSLPLSFMPMPMPMPIPIPSTAAYPQLQRRYWVYYSSEFRCLYAYAYA